MNKPRGILFDYGSTLFTQVAFDKEAGTVRLVEIANNPGGVGADEVLAAAEQLDTHVWPKRDETAFEFPMRTFQRLLFERLGMTFDRSPFEVELEFWKASIRLEPEPDLKVALEALRKRGLPLGIVSNSAFSGEVLQWELARHGLAERFQFLMSSADYGLRKPHPVLFQTAASKLNLKPEAVWFVGDTLQADVAGALHANMTAVWYNPGKVTREGPEPDLEVEAWSQFTRVVRDALRF